MRRRLVRLAAMLIILAAIFIIAANKHVTVEVVPVLPVPEPIELPSEPQACDGDAFVCPDGTVLGRSGPLCEFPACPTSEQSKPDPIVKNITPEPVLIPTQSTPPVVLQNPTSFMPSDLWKKYPNGPYTLDQAIADFKSSINGWEPLRMQIANGRLRTTLLKNTVGPAGGLVSWIDVPDNDEYELRFDMMFDENFDLSIGGKVGFGFLIGEGYTGGVPGTNGNGASVRLMWYKHTATSPIYLKPYVYYKDQPGQYGDDFGKKYPAVGDIPKGVWHKVVMHVKSNTGSNTDGILKITINGTILINQNIRYTTNDTKRLINRITFETFRGGADASWQSKTDGYIYFDNVHWEAM